MKRGALAFAAGILAGAVTLAASGVADAAMLVPPKTTEAGDTGIDQVRSRGGGGGYRGGGGGGYRGGGGFRGSAFIGGGGGYYRGGGGGYRNTYVVTPRYYRPAPRRFVYLGPPVAFYGGSYYYGGGGHCSWLYRRAVETGSPYWWSRYNSEC